MSDPDAPNNPPSHEDWGDDGVTPPHSEPLRSFLPPKREAPNAQGAGKVFQGSAAREERQAPPASSPKVREITARKAPRIRPDRPDLRMAGSVDRVRDDREREPWELKSNEHSRHGSGDMRWLLYAGLACLVLIIAGIVILPRVNRSKSPASSVDVGAARSMRERALLQDKEMEAMVASQTEAQRLFARYARSAVVDDVLPMLRDFTKVEPLVRHVGHRALVDYGWSPGSDANWSTGISEGRPYACLTGRFDDHRRFTAYFVRDAGRLCIDWKATVGYGTASFATLREGQGDTSEIRGTLFPDSYYNATYPEGTVQSYRLQAPDGSESVWCYVPLNTRLAENVAHLFVGGDLIRRQAGSAFVTLSLKRGPEGGMPNQWLIDRLLHEEWIEP
ncbi:MAG TPA: hypothetical protein VFY13_07620 [Luteolibacter sp.]|nr:hypothetical protein [Luteolibacter sp.]